MVPVVGFTPLSLGLGVLFRLYSVLYFCPFQCHVLHALDASLRRTCMLFWPTFFSCMCWTSNYQCRYSMSAAFMTACNISVYLNVSVSILDCCTTYIVLPTLYNCCNTHCDFSHLQCYCSLSAAVITAL